MIAFLPALAPITMIILIVWVIVGVTRDMKKGVKYFDSPIFDPNKTALPIPRGKLTLWKRFASGVTGILLMSTPFVVDFFFPRFLEGTSGGRLSGTIVAIGLILLVYAFAA